MKKYEFKIGDRVQYNHNFLKSITADYDTGIMKGTVQQVTNIGRANNVLVKILWDGDTEIHSALVSNLCRIGLDMTM